MLSVGWLLEDQICIFLLFYSNGGFVVERLWQKIFLIPIRKLCYSNWKSLTSTGWAEQKYFSTKYKSFESLVSIHFQHSCLSKIIVIVDFHDFFIKYFFCCVIFSEWNQFHELPCQKLWRGVLLRKILRSSKF